MICHADAKDPRSYAPTVGEKVGVHGCHSFPPAICPALVGLRSRFAIAPRPHRSAGYPGIIAGRIADRTQALRSTLAACAIATALAALRYLSAPGFWALLVVSLLHAVALAPTINLEHLDALLSDLCGEISRACGCPDGITSPATNLDYGQSDAEAVKPAAMEPTTIARAIGLPLKIAAKVDRVDQAYLASARPAHPHIARHAAPVNRRST